MTIKTYSELITIPTFIDRYEYLKTNSKVGESTFGSRRQLCQLLYHSKEWVSVRNEIIIRDNGCDLGMPDREILELLMHVHHINPITIEDIINRSKKIFDPENLILCSDLTHKAIHYSNSSILVNQNPIIRQENDTCPWKQIKI